MLLVSRSGPMEENAVEVFHHFTLEQIRDLWDNRCYVLYFCIFICFNEVVIAAQCIATF